MEQKRKEKRVKKENKLIFEIASADECIDRKKIYYTLTKNISLSGVSIRTDTFLPIDTVMKIELFLPRMHKRIHVRAKVRWIKSIYDDETFEVGLEFVDTPPDAISSLIGHLYTVEKKNGKKN